MNSIRRTPPQPAAPAPANGSSSDVVAARAITALSLKLACGRVEAGARAVLHKPLSTCSKGFPGAWAPPAKTRIRGTLSIGASRLMGFDRARRPFRARAAPPQQRPLRGQRDVLPRAAGAAGGSTKGLGDRRSRPHPVQQRFTAVRPQPCRSQIHGGRHQLQTPPSGLKQSFRWFLGIRAAIRDQARIARARQRQTQHDPGGRPAAHAGRPVFSHQPPLGLLPGASWRGQCFGIGCSGPPSSPAVALRSCSGSSGRMKRWVGFASRSRCCRLLGGERFGD